MNGDLSSVFDFMAPWKTVNCHGIFIDFMSCGNPDNCVSTDSLNNGQQCVETWNCS